MTTLGDIAVKTTDLTVRYGSTEAVKGITLTVKRGEFVSIVGKSGCGKTTFLKAVAGLLDHSGDIARRGRVRMIFQEGLLLPWLTVKSNIRIGLVEIADAGPNATESGGVDDGAGQGGSVESLMAEMGIGHLAESYPHEISGGERQRTAIARAFAARPEIVLMDEPFGALDVFTRERMQTWLLDFWQRHKVAVLFVTHDIEEGLVLGDRLMVMTDGTLEPDYPILFPRPRGAEIKYTEEFLAARRDIHRLIVG